MRAHTWRNQLIEDILQEAYLTITISEVSLTERIDLESKLNPFEAESDQSASTEETRPMKCSVHIRMRASQGRDQEAQELSLSGAGVGVIDASFEALANYLESEYPSLRSIQFKSFEMRGDVKDSSRSGAEAPCCASLVISNSDGLPFRFESCDRSMISASLQAVVRGIEHFVNAERAFIRIYKALEDAKSRSRQDLVERFTFQLSELVKTTSYTETIAQLRTQVNV